MEAHHSPSRRQFFQTTAKAVGAIPLLAAVPKLTAAPTKKSAAETAVKALYDSLTEMQKKEVCFAWDYVDKEGAKGLLRTFVSNNWQITKHSVAGGFYTKDQQALVLDIFKGLTNPKWYDRFMKQLKDDNEGQPFGTHQSLALFGKPGSDKFEFVLTGRHQTLRADGNTTASAAFGGPIFYGHAAETFNESKDHKGNVFWEQAIAANNVYKILGTKQQKQALVEASPKESAVGFRGKKIGEAPGLPVSEMTRDQQAEMQKVLALLIEPFRTENQEQVTKMLKDQGGLEKCVLSFFQDSDIGDDKVWDNWRLEGPSFVWYFRGKPHVHVWVNVADDPTIKTNARG